MHIVDLLMHKPHDDSKHMDELTISLQSCRLHNPNITPFQMSQRWNPSPGDALERCESSQHYMT